MAKNSERSALLDFFFRNKVAILFSLVSLLCLWISGIQVSFLIKEDVYKRQGLTVQAFEQPCQLTQFAVGVKYLKG